MKRLFILLISILIITLASVYIFIPGHLIISRSLNVAINKDALQRKLANSTTWQVWWPGENKKPGEAGYYTLDDILYKPSTSKIVSQSFFINGSAIKSDAELTYIRLNADSTTLHLQTETATSANPITRVVRYLEAKKIATHFSQLLSAIENKYASIPMLYGYDIQKKSVIDSTLLFTSAEIKGYPGVNIIYSMIDKLKAYIKKNGAIETGFPMLNIYTPDSTSYLVKVAIPIDKKIPDAGDISYRWMLGGGNILITEVKGGPQEIKKAYDQILHYISDYQRIAPAIPFESLVTDRRKEPDSSKWITKIYYPVM